MKKILRVDTGDKFISIRECCRSLPISHKTLEKILETGENHSELGTFEFIEEFEPLVVILETGEQFETVEECAKKIGCNRTTLSAHLNGKSKQIKGYHVKYYKDYDPDDKTLFGKEIKEKKIRKVLCYFVWKRNKREKNKKSFMFRNWRYF